MSIKIIKSALLGTAALSAAGLSIVQTNTVHADTAVDTNNRQTDSQADIFKNGGVLTV